MEFRDASVADSDALAAVAAGSLQASYGDLVDEDRADALADEWYEAERVSEDLAEDAADWVVAEDDGDVVGFAQATLLDAHPPVGEIHWLHVDPDARGEGVARQLLGHVQERVEKGGAERLRGLVLAANEDGAGFYEAHDFERVDEREVTVDDQQLTEYVYEKPIGDADEATQSVVEAVDGPEGDLYVNFSDADRGSEAPLYPAYRSRDLTEKYAWYCGNCEGFATTMDSMGRADCDDCDNYRSATRWDASYL